MNEINSPHFRMYWQPFQYQTPEENIINAKTVSPYAVNLHVFNWEKDKKYPLSGAMDEWQNYLKEFSSFHTLLLEFMPNDTLEELEAEATALRKIIGG